MRKTLEDRFEESLESIVERILSPLAAYVETMDVHSDEAGGEGWVADARRRLVDLVQVVEKDMDGLVLSSVQSGWDYYSTQSERCRGRFLEGESGLRCPHCLPHEVEMEWDMLNDLHRCPMCGAVYSGVDGVISEFEGAVKQAQ